MKVSIVGASGYAGGELLRLLLNHPDVEVSPGNLRKPSRRVRLPAASEFTKTNRDEILFSPGIGGV